MSGEDRDARGIEGRDFELVSFDVFGTLLDVREGSYAAFRSILADCRGASVDVKAFWEHWEHRNIVHYLEPYRRYREIAALSLDETLAHYSLDGRPGLIDRYFDAFRGFELFPDVPAVLDEIGRTRRLALVSNIDDDLLAATCLPEGIDLACTAERARGYKPDGTLFRYLIDNAGVPKSAILHAGQSQYTDLVGGKPLGLTVVWVNRRGVERADGVPAPDAMVADVAAVAALLRRQGA